ncbi:PRC-barrel domain-containing protein [Paracoccus marinaquae]|uniref:PRC-barrel domain-containing protein n=1 Tax=Paracoccus marinaquae TaxID=2841926 RepID=A0ABS6ALH7_9RHOB|nr:PRC-barrel domain-containing protein [Paracoccus marinaquae]MBU3030504.1 PRC-barrel domain-containing protein [Paracoccus marinaquae]
MRKLLMTTIIALPLAIGPALAQDAAGTDDPAMPGEATTLPADPAAGTTEMTADPAAAQEAMAAEVAASGKVAQQQAANELRLDWITDATVTAPDGSGIGDINDLIVDGETGQMIAAIIGVGGFLGIGEKQIAVPFDQLTVNYDAQEITSDLTKEEAEAAPEYVFREREAAPALTPVPATVDPAAEPAPATDAMPMEGGAMDGEMPMEAETMGTDAMETPPTEAEPMERAVEGAPADPAGN